MKFEFYPLIDVRSITGEVAALIAGIELVRLILITTTAWHSNNNRIILFSLLYKLLLSFSFYVYMVQNVHTCTCDVHIKFIMATSIY